MKKYIVIIIALLLLVSKMHLSMATHICGGKVAATKWSLSGKTATCGMTEQKQACTNHQNVTSSCCKDIISSYEVDTTYEKSSTSISNPIKAVPVFYNPLVCRYISPQGLSSLSHFLPPPNPLSTSRVSLSKICVFRI